MADQAAEGLLSPWLRSQRIQHALPYIRGRVLDFGCGVGALAAYLSPDAYRGVERDPESLALARERYPTFCFEDSLITTDTFDTIVALAVIEHIEDPVGLLKALRARLQPAGHIVVTTPHPGIKGIYRIGTALGLFSRHAHEEHQALLDLSAMQGICNQAELSIRTYQRFLLGCNQLFVLVPREARTLTAVRKGFDPQC